MLHPIKNKLIHLKKAAGITIKLLPGDRMEIAVCLLENKKGVVNILQKKAGLSSVKEIKTYLPDDIPVFLVLNGKGVLHKQINNDHVDKSDLLAKAIPNARMQDFYLQITTESNYLSVIRQGVVNKVLEDFKGHGISVTHVSLGPFILNPVLNFVELPGDASEIIVDDYALDIIDNTILKLSQLKEAEDKQAFKIGEEIVENKLVVSYAAALSFFTDGDIQRYSILSESTLYEEWEQRRIFKNLSKVLLAFVFLILLVNALLYLNLNQTNQELTYRLSVNAQDLQHLKTLENEVQRKKNLLQTIGWTDRKPVSYFADRLAATVPVGISWTELTVHPFDERLLKNEKQQVFENNIIHAKGKCKNPIVLNDWLIEVEQLEWVNEVNKQAYNYNEREGTGFFEFDIILRKN